jgi:hypothetical protein
MAPPLRLHCPQCGTRFTVTADGRILLSPAQASADGPGGGRWLVPDLVAVLLVAVLVVGIFLGREIFGEEETPPPHAGHPGTGHPARKPPRTRRAAGQDGQDGQNGPAAHCPAG